MITKFFIFINVALLSCTYGNEVQPIKEFRIKIIDKVPFCPLTIIEFQAKDLRELEKISGQTGELRCQTYNLPEKFSQIGQALKVSVRKTSEEEYFPCITLGPGFPYSLVTIVNVIDK